MNLNTEDRKRLAEMAAERISFLQSARLSCARAEQAVYDAEIAATRNLADRLALGLVSDPDAAENEASIREKAREKCAYGSGSDIEIDEDAAILEGNDGYWVAAWVFIPGPGEDEEDTETPGGAPDSRD